MFKKGDILECVSSGSSSHLTVGKLYTVISHVYELIIINDYGLYCNYLTCKFKLAENKMTTIEKKREELKAAILIVKAYNIGITRSHELNRTPNGYYGDAGYKNLQQIVEWAIPDPKQTEIKRIESEMRKLADDLLKLKG